MKEESIFSGSDQQHQQITTMNLLIIDRIIKWNRINVLCTMFICTCVREKTVLQISAIRN